MSTLPRTVKQPKRLNTMPSRDKLSKLERRHINSILQIDSVYRLRKYCVDNGIKTHVIKKYVVWLRLKNKEVFPLSVWEPYINAFDKR